MLRLETLRKQSGLSQEELAQKVNLTQQRISSYEKGKRQPDLETLIQFASFFDCSTDFLLGISDIKNPEKLLKTSVYSSDSKEFTPEEIVEAIRLYKEIKKII